MSGKGYFITFEGMDGSGKSTQIQLLQEWFIHEGYEVVMTREPGGTAIGEKIRQIILDPNHKEMDDVTEAYLYASSRAQLVRQLVLPAITAGKIVICDRFLDSSIAYQGYGRNMGDKVLRINEAAVDGCMPDLTFYLRLEPEGGRGRINDRELDRMELQSTDFQDRTFAGYETLAGKEPDRVVAINARHSIEEIHEEIVDRVSHLIKGK